MILERIVLLSLFLLLPLCGCSGGGESPPALVAPVAPVEPVQQAVLEIEEEEDEVDYEEMEIEEVLEAAKELVERENWEEALRAVTVLLEDDTEPLDYHFMMGQVFFHLEKYHQAVDELEYALTKEGEGREDFEADAKDLVSKLEEKSVEIAKKLYSMADDLDRAMETFVMLKINPKIRFEAVEPPEGKEKKKLIYFKVTAMEKFKAALETDKVFWNYYCYSYLNFHQKWYSDARKAIDKSLSLADSQQQIFFALQLQAKIQEEAPKEASSDLDKLSTLDLTEDMLDEFLEKYSKDLTEKQIKKAREVIKMGMKLKERLDKAKEDLEKLDILRDFKKLSEEMLAGEDFPPDIKSKVEKGTVKANERLEELEEQIRIKTEALKG